MAGSLNPNNILNVSLNLTHLRPLSARWSCLVSAGCGIYAPIQSISGHSGLAKGGAVFIYKLNRNLDIGVGAGLTNSYGIPMIMPMLYLNWRQAGKYEFTIDMSSGLKMAIATQLNPRIRLELTALEMNGLTAVVPIDGKSRLYSNLMIHSTLKASLRIHPKASLYMGVGGNWVRSINWSERSLKGFVENFKDDDKRKPEFAPALRLTAGLHYAF